MSFSTTVFRPLTSFSSLIFPLRFPCSYLWPSVYSPPAFFASPSSTQPTIREISCVRLWAHVTLCTNMCVVSLRCKMFTTADDDGGNEDEKWLERHWSNISQWQHVCVLLHCRQISSEKREFFFSFSSSSSCFFLCVLFYFIFFLEQRSLRFLCSASAAVNWRCSRRSAGY